MEDVNQSSNPYYKSDTDGAVVVDLRLLKPIRITLHTARSAVIEHFTVHPDTTDLDGYIGWWRQEPLRLLGLSDADLTAIHGIQPSHMELIRAARQGRQHLNSLLDELLGGARHHQALVRLRERKDARAGRA